MLGLVEVGEDFDGEAQFTYGGEDIDAERLGGRACPGFVDAIEP